MELKRDKRHIELLRIIAILFVIYNHTRNHGFNLYLYTDNPATHYASYCLSVLCKIGVPLFLMISGALLIPKEESIKILFTKRVARMCFVILIFTLLQYLRICLAQNTVPNFYTYIAYCYAGNVIEPYWYLKAYLGYLIALPFIRAIARNMDKNMAKYVLWLGLARILIDVIAIITGYQLNVNIIICTDILFYPLLGHIVESGLLFDESVKLKKNVLVIALLLSVLIVTVCFGELYATLRGNFSESFFSVSLFPLTMLTYVLAKNMKVLGGKGGKVLANLGECVFGVYLIEDVLRNFFEFRLKWNFGIPSPFVSAILFTLCVLILGIAVIWPIKRIPIIKKLI